MYNDLLGEKSLADKEAVSHPREMIMDEVNRKMVMENAIRTICAYEDEFRHIYLIYAEENYWALKKQGRLLLTQREVELQNKKVTAVSFIRFLKEADILPHLINIEHVEEILSRVVPAIKGNAKESEFYFKHFLVDSYSKDLDNSETKSEGDPGLLLFEFIIMIARIAVETNKEMDNTKKVFDYILNKFFSSYLFIRSNEDLIRKKEFPNINKPFLNNLKKFYHII